MDPLEFRTAMDRILCFYPRVKEGDKEEEKDYLLWLEAILKKVCWMRGDRFLQVVDQVLESRPRFRRDLDHRKFVAVYKELAEELGWDRDKSGGVCSTCQGCGFVYVWVRCIANDPLRRWRKGEEFKAMLGCHTCNEGYRDIDAKQYEKCEGPTSPPVTVENLQLRPDLALVLWDIAEKSNLNLPDDLLAKILEFAGQAEKPKVPWGRDVATVPDHVLKNRAIRQLAEAEAAAGTVGEAPAKTEPLSAPAEQPSPAMASEDDEPPMPEETADEPPPPPAVAHIPKAVRKILDAEAKEQGIPF